MSAKKYIVMLAVLGNLALVSEGSPGIFTLMGLVNGIEKLPGGGDLLDDLIKNLKGITEDQLKQVNTLMQLIDARDGDSDGGFLHMLTVVDSSPGGHRLLQKTIGLLANISNPEIATLEDLVHLASGQVNASQGVSLIGDFLDGQVGRGLLFGVLGPNRTIQAQQFLPALSELLHSGSIADAVDSLLTPGTKANMILLKLVGKIGGSTVISSVEDILPLVGPVLSYLLDPSKDTQNSILNLLGELNANLQNETVRGKVGAGFVVLTKNALKEALDILSRLETIQHRFNFTVSHPPMESLMSFISVLNTSLSWFESGNNSFADFLANIVDHDGSPEELGLSLIEVINELLLNPTTTGFLAEKNSTLQMIGRLLKLALKMTDTTLGLDVDNLMNLLTELSDLNNQTVDLETQCAAVMAKVLSKLAVHELKYRALEKHQNSTLQELQNLKEEHDNTVKELEASRNEVTRVQTELNSLEQTQKSTLLQLQQLKQEHAVTLKKLEDARAERNNTESELSTSQVEWEELGHRQNMTSLEVQVVRTEVKEVQSEILASKAKLNDLEQIKNSTVHELQQLRQGYHMTMTELEDARNERKHGKDEILMLKAKLDEIEQNQNTTSNEIDY